MTTTKEQETDFDLEGGWLRPGLLRVSRSAVAKLTMLARGGADPRTRDIVGVALISRRTWTDRTGRSFEAGPGFEVGVWHRQVIPDEALHFLNGKAFVFQIPSSFVMASQHRLLDMDGEGALGFVLR